MTQAPRGYDDLPETELSVNQVVALNLRYFRMAAGMTQRQLGAIVGLSHENISNLERSAEPGRTRREFNADLIAALGLALHVPVAAFFLPPDDDGVTTRYVAAAADQVTADMQTLFTYAMSEPTDDDTPSMHAYLARIRSCIAAYVSVPPGEATRYFEDLTTDEQRQAALAKLDWQLPALRSVLADLDQIRGELADETRADD